MKNKFRLIFLSVVLVIVLIMAWQLNSTQAEVKSLQATMTVNDNKLATAEAIVNAPINCTLHSTQRLAVFAKVNPIYDHQLIDVDIYQVNCDKGKPVSVSGDVRIQNPLGVEYGTGIFGNDPSKVTVSWKEGDGNFVLQNISDLEVYISGYWLPVHIDSVFTGTDE